MNLPPPEMRSFTGHELVQGQPGRRSWLVRIRRRPERIGAVPSASRKKDPPVISLAGLFRVLCVMSLLRRRHLSGGVDADRHFDVVAHSDAAPCPVGANVRPLTLEYPAASILLRAAASAAVVVDGLSAPGLGVLVADGGMEVDGVPGLDRPGPGDGVDGVDVPDWACAMPAAPINAIASRADFMRFTFCCRPAEWQAWQVNTPLQPAFRAAQAFWQIFDGSRDRLADDRVHGIARAVPMPLQRNSIQAGAWSLGLSSPRTARSTPPFFSRSLRGRS